MQRPVVLIQHLGENSHVLKHASFHPLASISLRFAAMLLTTLVLLVGCGRARESIDRVRYPRHGFGAIWVTSDYYLMNTFDGSVTYYTGEPPVAHKVALRLSEGTLDSIYAVAIHHRIFDLPQPHPPGAFRNIQPDLPTSFELRSGHIRRTFAWTMSDIPVERTWNDWQRLYGFKRMLDSVVFAQPVYRRLPPPRLRPM